MKYQFSERMSKVKASSIREILKVTQQDSSIISFTAGSPSPESFPIEEFAEISKEIFETMPIMALQYNITEGYRPLIDKIDERLKDKFKIGKDFDSTCIVTGGQQALDFAAKVLCNEGDTVICENPSFVGGLNAFRSYGANLVGIDMDEEGIKLDDLKQAVKNNSNVKLIYLIPTFQNPSGRTMSQKRREDVYALALENNILIVEDNPYGELRFKGEEVLPIKSMDTEGIVIYLGSFSKTLSAGMRLGFVTGPKEIVQKFVIAKQSADIHTNIFFQILTHKYLDKYNFDDHVEKIKKLYLRKSDLMVNTIENNFDKRIKFTKPEGGLFVWATMPEGTDMDNLVKKSLENKVAFVPGGDFMVNQDVPYYSIRLNYSTPSDEDIVKGIKILAKVTKDCLENK